MSLIPGIDGVPWPSGSTNPSPGVNTAIERVAFLARGGVLSRTTTAEPATPANGEAYIIPGSATGTNWSTYAVNDVAVWLAGAWFVIEPADLVGVTLLVLDEGQQVAWEGAAYEDVGGAGGGSSDTVEVVAIAGATHDLIATDRGKKLRFTGTDPVLTVQHNVTEGYPQGSVYHASFYGTGTLTIAEETAVTINVPAGGTLEVPPGGTVTLHRVAEDEWDLFGLTLEAP